MVDDKYKKCNFFFFAVGKTSNHEHLCFSFSSEGACDQLRLYYYVIVIIIVNKCIVLIYIRCIRSTYKQYITRFRS